MQSQNWYDSQYMGPDVLNASESGTLLSESDIVASLFSPGLMNFYSNINFAPSGNNLTITFGLPFRIIFANGHLAGPYGTVAGAQSNVYNLAFTLPPSGSQQQFIVATEFSLPQNLTNIVGPPPGHPAYDPTFGPSQQYLTTMPSFSLAVTTVQPDNVTAFEVGRTTVNAGQTSLGTIFTSYAALAQPRQALLPPVLRYETSGSGSFTVPPGVQHVSIYAGGGGGAGGGSYWSSNNGSNPGALAHEQGCGGGGAAGDTAWVRIPVRAGQVISWTIGAGGSNITATTGGTTYVYIDGVPVLQVWGGQNAGGGAGYCNGGGPGVLLNGPSPYPGSAYYPGNFGSDGQNGLWTFPGNGGAGPFGGAPRAGTWAGTTNPAQNAVGPSSGGAGVYDTNGTGGHYYGGNGAAGFVHLTLNSYPGASIS